MGYLCLLAGGVSATWSPRLELVRVPKSHITSITHFFSGPLRNQEHGNYEVGQKSNTALIILKLTPKK